MLQETTQPIVVADLTYGSIVTPEQVVAFTGVSQDSRDYSLRLLETCKMIEGALKLRDGKEYDVVTRKDAIHVLRPSEALHNSGTVRRKRAHKTLKKSLRKLNDIPVSELSEEEQKDLQTAQHRIGLIVDFAQKNRRTLPEVEKTHERPTPAV